MQEYKGTRWFKCDFHLHTKASKCFADNTMTAKQWVDRAIEQGLDCVAVTDHNTGSGIDEIKAVAEEKKLIVFPGVEITCDTSKIHLLVLFDVSKTSDDIRDFLVRANIRAEDFGEQDAISDKSIMEITDLANGDGAIVIPAHIDDDYNGLISVGDSNLKNFLKKDNLNAVQIIKEPTNTSKPIRYAKEANNALLTFSDNPHEEGSPQHGLWGIGQDYSWIKMDEKPSLESLRQAFLLPEFRVKNKFESLDIPYTMPNIWIKSISINNTVITNSLNIDFNPQLNAIIGGRGTGKSSILRFIRGVFNRTLDLGNLLSEHEEFYKIESGRPKKGILKDDSTIEIEISRDNVLHKVIASDIKKSDLQKIEIQRYNEETEGWENITDEGYIDFLEFEQYSQKQIYEIAQEPNALRERVDSAINDVDRLKREREHIKNRFLEKSTEIRTIEQQISQKGIVQTKIVDFDRSIKKLQESGISELLTQKERFLKEKSFMTNLKNELEVKEELLIEIIGKFNIQNIDYRNFSDTHKEVLEPISKLAIESIDFIQVELNKLKLILSETKNRFDNSVNESAWKVDYNNSITDFTRKKEELEEVGITDISDFEKFIENKVALEKQLEDIDKQIEIQEVNLQEKNTLQNYFLAKSKEITVKRKEFIRQVLQDDRVKIEIKPFRDKSSFESKLRIIINKEDRFEEDIDILMKLCFQGNVEDKIKEVRKIFSKIKNNEDINQVVSGHFINLVKRLDDSQIDKIELLLPEDEIKVQYKATNLSQWKSLSTASAGQKTTAILTFILSYGDTPLILDQPEDDLDNRLVYDLIVDRLKKAKEKRQLIVVTHNANIPVNGDAEYIVSMDTESEKLKVLHAGTVESVAIKKEICDVMEGSEQAFKMRSKRYEKIGT